jgi:hypothetical protein
VRYKFIESDFFLDFLKFIKSEYLLYKKVKSCYKK